MSSDTVFNFADAAAPGEKIIENVSIGYPGIVVGEAYIIDTFPSEAMFSENIIEEGLRGTEAQKVSESVRRAIALYNARLAKVDTLPVETYEEARTMLEAELSALKNLQEVAGRPFEKQSSAYKQIYGSIAAGHPAAHAVHTTFKEKIEHFDQQFESVAEQLSALEKAGPLDEENRTVLESLKLQYELLSKSQGIFLALQSTLMQNLDPKGQPTSIEEAPDDSIPVTKHMAVGDMVHFRNETGLGTRMHGMIVWSGVDKDHTHIIARSSRITAANITEQDAKFLRPRDIVIIDGPGKKVIVNPAPQTIKHYEDLLAIQRMTDKKLLDRSHRRRWPKTVDGKQIKVSANIGYSDEMQAVEKTNAGKIGLYRTEVAVLSNFLYTPDEDKWYEIFKHITEQAKGRAITIRTVDFDGDKVKESIEKIANDPEKRNAMIRQQMAATLRVQRHVKNAKLFMMIPMVRDKEQFEEMQTIMNEEARKLGVEPIHLGIMVEVPGVIDKLKDIDALFFSVGSNDLIPYILGYDRFGPDSDRLYDPTDPQVLEALEKIAGYQSSKREVSLCGDMATDPRYVALLVGAGFKHLSAGVGMVPVIKELIRSIHTEQAKELFETLKRTEHRADREKILDDFNETYLGLRRDGTIDMDWEIPEGSKREPKEQ